MFGWLLGVAAVGRIAQDEIHKNRPYYGTKRDFLKDNPEIQEHNKRMAEIYAKYSSK